ncbi:hypothetical protein [Spirosoma luteum]|uniref:hypothetical protein n=1 Tax=Spirosoma luteum TaxID=431553 RepID=UPI00035D1968|nr:hypothetical protein [Spirosoma luteum]
MKDIYKLIVSKDKLNRKFELLSQSRGFSPAKVIIENIARLMTDKDGNFIQQFQSNGFEARLWEIYLFVLFKEIGFTQSNKYDRPDFHLIKGDTEIFVEASVSIEKEDEIFSEENIKDAISKNDLIQQQQLINYYIIRMGSVLFSKLNKEYWKLNWVTGKPIVLAITPTHNYLASFLPDAKLTEYLYGIRQKVKLTEDGFEDLGAEQVEYFQFDNKRIPANFFAQPLSQNISGVLFTNNADLHKFNRMAYESALTNEELIIVRTGAKYNPQLNSVAIDFTYQVRHNEGIENWCESVTLFHNPNALHKIDKETFNYIRQVWKEPDDTFDGIMPNEFVFSSVTGVMFRE